ncbi:MAG: ATP-dependent DNA helicase RecG [Candidatus Roizmanbacteria bacterium]|nr:ATP-dependent DNA helicase RecG [Candidatus Roizmanbacteria bacterium]
MLDLQSNLLELPGIGPSTAIKLATKNIETVSNLLMFFPIRYKDFSQVSTIQSLQPGDDVSIRGIVQSCISMRTKKRNLTMQRVLIQDNTKSITALFFNQPYICSTLLRGSDYYFSGTVDKFSGSLVFKVAEYAQAQDSDAIHTSTLVPYYSTIDKMSVRYIRTLIQKTLKLVPKTMFTETLPQLIVKKNRLPTLLETIKTLHHPNSKQTLALSRYRLVYEELFQLLLTNVRISKKRKNSLSRTISIEKYRDIFEKTLPFVLTKDQSYVIDELSADMMKTNPMNRLVIGDVGCGKTVVAACSAYAAAKQGFKTIFLVPTSVLAKQHFETLTKIFAAQNIEIGLMTSAEQKTSINSAVTEGVQQSAQILIATHAFFHTKLDYKNVALVIVDEQHKFGTKQRELLLERTKDSKYIPHMISLSATPIPRTLALTLYGSVDCSYIHTMPKIKASVVTKFVEQVNKEKAYVWIYDRIRNNKEQVFVVCPLIEQSDNPTMSVENVFESLKRRFPDLIVDYLHGRLKHKERILHAFKEHAIDILVSTTVIEVGIDIPNATIMMIESAQQFGLAQLHQLRGRVGRAEKKGYCFLFTDENDVSSMDRIKLMEKSSDGFYLAQKDLELRGPGNLIGLQQKGYILHYAKNVLNIQLLEDIRADVEKVLANNPTFTYNSLIAPIETESEDIQYLN